MLDIAFVQLLLTGLINLFGGMAPGPTLYLTTVVSYLPTIETNSPALLSTFITTQLALVEVMISEARDPTPIEWDALTAAVQAITGQPQAPASP